MLSTAWQPETAVALWLDHGVGLWWSHPLANQWQVSTDVAREGPAHSLSEFIPKVFGSGLCAGQSSTPHQTCSSVSLRTSLCERFSKGKVWFITLEHTSPLLWGPVAACGPPLQLMLCMALSDLLLGCSYSAIERSGSWVNLKATQSLKVCGYRLC